MLGFAVAVKGKTMIGFLFAGVLNSFVGLYMGKVESRDGQQHGCCSCSGTN